MRRIISLIALVVLLVFFIFIGYLWQQLSYPSRITLSDYHSDWGQSFVLPTQNITFTTTDHTLISGWFIPGDLRMVVIITEGWGQNRNKALKYSKLVHDLGYSVLTFDYRGQGASAAGRCTLGGDEVLDMAAAVRYIREHYPQARIVLYGISIGGYTALRYAAQDKAIAGIIVDSAYSDVGNLMRDWFNYNGYGFMSWVSPLVQGLFSRARLSPIAQTIPLLILHSTDDQEVPVAHAVRLAQRFPQATVVLFEKAKHAECYRTQPHQYQRVLGFFLKEVY